MRKILLAVACVAVVMACSTAPARAQSVTLTPFCDDTTIGGPGSGFLVSAPSTSFITLHFITAGLGEFNVSPEVDLVAAGFPPGIGATTLEVYEDPNHNLRVDPGERLLETQSHEDPCGPPPPTTKDQCKNGGWRQFGFQNQGGAFGSSSTGRRGKPPGCGSRALTTFTRVSFLGMWVLRFGLVDALDQLAVLLLLGRQVLSA